MDGDPVLPDGEAALGLPLRQTAGMVAGVLEMGWAGQCRISLRLKPQTDALRYAGPPPPRTGPLNLLLDKTGIKFVG